jgi:hypothetical protein
VVSGGPASPSSPLSEVGADARNVACHDFEALPRHIEDGHDTEAQARSRCLGRDAPTLHKSRPVVFLPLFAPPRVILWSIKQEELRICCFAPYLFSHQETFFLPAYIFCTQ